MRAAPGREGEGGGGMEMLAVVTLSGNQRMVKVRGDL